MAHGLSGSAATSDVDRHYLDYLEGAWRDLPAIEREWPSWEEFSRLDFVLEWPIKEERRMRLEAWAKEGALTPEQFERYRQLQDLMRRHAPILERLLSEDDPTIPGRNAS